MSDRPVFLYAAIYSDILDAELDYDAVFDLRAAGLISKEDDGKVRVSKTEKPTQHGAWTGAGVGALPGLIFPPAIIASAVVGSGIGALSGHISGGMSRGELKALGEELDAGTTGLIVFGDSRIDEQLARATTRASKLIEKELDTDGEELEREIAAATHDSAPA